MVDYRPGDTFNHMVELNANASTTSSTRLRDTTRRDMLRRLAQREHTVSELAEPFHMSLAAASKHIRTLEDAGLIRRTVEGRTHRCRIEPGPDRHRPLAAALREILEQPPRRPRARTEGVIMHDYATRIAPDAVRLERLLPGPSSASGHS